MKPTEFLSAILEECELSDKPKKAGQVILNDILITDGCFTYEVLSYYYSPEDKRMVLDIKEME